MDYISEHSDNVSEANVDITGGELFFRNDLERMYERLVDITIETKQRIKKPIRVLIGTNLLYENIDLLYHTLDYVFSRDETLLRGVFTSFDIVGRFNSKEKIELHHRNTLRLFEYLHSHKIPLAIVSVLSREAMTHFMSPITDLDNAFMDVYNEYYELAKTVVEPENGNWWLRLSWTALSPNTMDTEYTTRMVPTVDEYVEFYKYLVNNYNTLAIIHSFYDNSRSLRCGNNCHVCKTDYVEKSCDSNIYGKDLLKDENLHIPSNDPIEIYQYLVEKYGCLTCKYLKKCYIRPCPAVLNLKTVEQGDGCWRKEIYEYVEHKEPNS